MLVNLATLVAVAKLRRVQFVYVLAIGALLAASCGAAEPVEGSAAPVPESVAPVPEAAPQVNEIDGEGLAVPGEPVVLWFWSPD